VKPSPPHVLSLGFRVFFLLGILHAAVVVALWSASLAGRLDLAFAGLPPIAWHAHEMVFGFSRAIIAGFLLTAVRNWTGRETPTGWPLGWLATLWALPRVLITVGGPGILGVAATVDLLFGALLVAVVARPVAAVRQWRQVGLLTKLGLLWLAQAAFYATALGALPWRLSLGPQIGVYLVLAVILTISGRVVPFFVRAALPQTPPPPSGPGWTARSCSASWRCSPWTCSRPSPTPPRCRRRPWPCCT